MTDPGAPARLALAEHFLGIGQAQSALRALDDAGGAALEIPYYWGLRATALNELDRHADALAAARSGLKLEPESTWLLSVAAHAAAELDHLSEAERLVLAALHVDAEDPELLAQYAVVLVRGGQGRKASAVLERAERIAPDDPTVMRVRGLLAFLGGNDRAARRHAERVLAEHDPEDPGAHGILGATAALRGRAGVASDHLDRTARFDVRDHAAAARAREARIEAHWLLVPMRLVTRFGPGPIWIVGVGVGLGLQAAGYEEVALVWILAYVLFAIYTWVGPPLARRFLRWRMR